MVNICCVKGCKCELAPGSGLSMHRFPTHPESRKKWLAVVPTKVTKTSVVCSQHFKPDDFTLGGLLRKKLKQDAVPSIFPVTSGFESCNQDDVPSASTSQPQAEKRGRHSKYEDSDTSLSLCSDPEDTTENPQDQEVLFTWQKSPVSCPEESAEANIVQEQQTMIVDEKNKKTEHSEYICNACKRNISGVRYKCVQCSDYDVCAACEACGVHAIHYALRVPEHSVQVEVLRIIKAIRKCLNEDPSTVMIPEVKEEVKDELVITEDPSDVEECDPLQSALDEQQVPQNSEREDTEIDHSTQQALAKPSLHALHATSTLHATPTLHTTPTLHATSTLHATPRLHTTLTTPKLHTTHRLHNAPTQHTMTTQYAAHTRPAPTAATYYAQIATQNPAPPLDTSTESVHYTHNITASSSQIAGSSTESNRNPMLAIDPINSSMCISSRELTSSAKEKSPEHRLLGKRSKPSDEIPSSLKQPLRINFKKIAMPLADQSDNEMEKSPQ